MKANVCLCGFIDLEITELIGTKFRTHIPRDSGGGGGYKFVFLPLYTIECSRVDEKRVSLWLMKIKYVFFFFKYFKDAFLLHRRKTVIYY